jgi:large subunit ribosomal protein L28
MLKICAICGKSQVAGKSIVRKGLAKKKGGTGKKVTRSTGRTFHTNLQKIRILINNQTQKVYVCTKCIKKGRVQKA